MNNLKIQFQKCHRSTRQENSKPLFWHNFPESKSSPVIPFSHFEREEIVECLRNMTPGWTGGVWYTSAPSWRKHSFKTSQIKPLKPYRDVILGRVSSYFLGCLAVPGNWMNPRNLLFNILNDKKGKRDGCWEMLYSRQGILPTSLPLHFDKINTERDIMYGWMNRKSLYILLHRKMAQLK